MFRGGRGDKCVIWVPLLPLPPGPVEGPRRAETAQKLHLDRFKTLEVWVPLWVPLLPLPPGLDENPQRPKTAQTRNLIVSRR